MTATILPKAWMGMNFDFEPSAVRICCRCPDRDEAETLARSLDLPMTHGECPDCVEAFMQALATMRSIGSFIDSRPRLNVRPT